ncbi:MAG: diaminopimelate epimerase [bacterium]|nr:diaminopimelate epimerase [bacterium]
MGRLRFTKMQGTGNDYVYLNLTEEQVSKPQDLAIRLSDRRFGIGSDGLVLIDRGRQADLSMRMFNADGSESEMCGNAIRCVAKYGFEHGLVQKTELTVETLAGTKEISLILDDWGRVDSVRVNMGLPELDPARIPALVEGTRCIDQTFDFGSFAIKGTLVSMGNPHLVTFVEDLENTPVGVWGPIIETDPRFPNRINVEFLQLVDSGHAKQRTWERGSGETLSCGTGASAALVAGVLTSRLTSPARIQLLGGELTIEWPGEGGALLMSGDAVEVFEGHVER